MSRLAVLVYRLAPRAPLVAAAAAFLAHASALAGGFVWLDHAHIEDGLAIAPLTELGDLFTHGFAGTGFYRPLMALSLSLDAAWSRAPFLFHLTTLLCHATAAACVVWAARALALGPAAALVAGVSFGVHPAGSLVAGAIAFRSESLMTIALLAAVVAHLGGRPRLMAVAVFAGALTKETAFALAPLVLIALELRQGPRGRFARLSWPAGAWLLALALRLAYAPSFRAEAPSLAFDAAIGSRLAALGQSVLLAFAPWDRNVCDAFPVTMPWSPRALLGAAALAALVVLAVRRRGPAVLLALTLLPLLQIVPIMRWWSPHYVYLPLAFAAMLGAERLARRPKVIAPALGVLACVSFWDGRRFASDTHLWTAEVEAQPGCREGHLFLGDAALAERRVEPAARHYEAAIIGVAGVMSYVDRGAALQNLGVARLEQGKLQDARVALEAARAVVSDPRRRQELAHNLALVHLQDRRPAEAFAELAPGLEGPEAHPASVALAIEALRALGRSDEARALASRLRR